MTKCVFCGKEESPYKGVHLIKNDGSTSFFCSSKCRRNALNLKRDKNKLKWTEAFRITRQRGIEKKNRDTESKAKKELKTEEKKEEVKESKK
jgi:large subunit ribosomal protein L24e